MQAPTARVRRFALLSALGFSLVLALVWTLVARERATRSLLLEYEAYRTATAMVEDFRLGLERGADERVLGFGLYGWDGEALTRRGSAPSRLSLEGERGWGSELILGSGAVRVLRLLGGETPGGMMGPGMGRRMGMPRYRDDPAYGPRPAPPGQPGQPDPAVPRAVYLEYSGPGFLADRAALHAGAALVTAAFAVLWAVLVGLYRRNEELRLRSARDRELAELGEAARTLAHEIKNPLAVIRVQTATIRRSMRETPARGLDVIDEEVDRLVAMSDRIREFLKGGAGEPRLLELGPALVSFAARYAGSGPGLALAEPPGGAMARVDPDRLARALDNLVRNAVEAAPDSPPELALARRGKDWEITVSDRGGGVPAEAVGRIFEPFFTTKEKGSGIGLALAKRLVEASGGGIEYRDRPGGGAVFALRLPAAG